MTQHICIYINKEKSFKWNFNLELWMEGYV